MLFTFHNLLLQFFFLLFCLIVLPCLESQNVIQSDLSVGNTSKGCLALEGWLGELTAFMDFVHVCLFCSVNVELFFLSHWTNL